MDLRRTVPFLDWGSPGQAASFRLDRIRLLPGQAPGVDLAGRIEETLCLGTIGEVFTAEEAILLVEEQYDASLEHIYAHGLWGDFRDGSNRPALLSYLLETRHYLHAALWRMAPGPAGATAERPIHELLVRHLLEEADHARYFERALAELGVPPEIVRRLRPLPATYEWVHLMRSLGATDPLTAALCSGLMERSARERDAVAGWHAMLAEAGLLPQKAVDAIYDHVREDIDLGHGGNWQAAIVLEAPIVAHRLAGSLNAVCMVTEMIYRWLSAVRFGLSGVAVEALIEAPGAACGSDAADGLDPFFDGLPCWPAGIYDSVSRNSLPAGASRAVALSYMAGPIMANPGSEVEAWALRLTRQLSVNTADAQDEEGIRAAVGEWMRSVDGHRLWSDMAEDAGTVLTQGWLVENYFYLRSSSVHTARALASCDCVGVRGLLNKHLEEESDHEVLLARALVTSELLPDLERCRPLPTTAAFTHWLADLASKDWPAYCVAIYFLQATLVHGSVRHADFYDAVTARNPHAAAFVDAMRRHDQIDGALDHGAEMERLLRGLLASGQLSATSLRRAALVGQMVWSFLDGIWEHYRCGPAALRQRVGWQL